MKTKFSPFYLPQHFHYSRHNKAEFYDATFPIQKMSLIHRWDYFFFRWFIHLESASGSKKIEQLWNLQIALKEPKLFVSIVVGHFSGIKYCDTFFSFQESAERNSVSTIHLLKLSNLYNLIISRTSYVSLLWQSMLFGWDS